MMKKLILILGDQLDINSSALRDFDPSTDEVLMVESQNESTYVWSHKAKIAIFLSAMRHFAEQLKERGLPLIYIEQSAQSIGDTLRDLIPKKQRIPALV